MPPGQTEDEDGTIVNPGGNVAPGLNRGEHIDKPDNPNKPDKPENPGTEDSTDSKVNKANSGTHIYTYDELNRMVSSDIAKVVTNYTYDTLGNLVLETSKNKSVDYEYNELNQLVRKTTSNNEVYTYTYDKRGNRIAETGKKASQSFVYDATNRLVEGTNWKGDTSAYTYNGLGLRVNNLVTTHAGQTYDRDYVIDYTSPENDDLYVYAMGNGQLEYEQRHVYAGSERLEQITEKGNGGWERTLYVHEDVMGNTRYYTKATGQTFAELQYDAWGQPVSPNKLLNNDHGNYVFATFTGHIYDTTLDIYFAEARFYDATNRTWLAMDPIKDGLNWYQYVKANPVIYMDANGEYYISVSEVNGNYEVTVHEENGTVLGVINAVNEVLPFVNWAYDVYREHNDAYIGSTYTPGQATQSQFDSLEDIVKSIGEDELIEALAKAGKVAASGIIKGVSSGVSAASGVKGYADGTLSVLNEDILFDMVNSGAFDNFFNSQKQAYEYADNLNMALQNGLNYIAVGEFFNQNTFQNKYGYVPPMYDIATQIEEIQRAGGSAAAVQNRIDSLINRYAFDMYEERLKYYMNEGFMEKAQIEKTYPGGFDAFMQNELESFKAELRTAIGRKNYYRYYFMTLTSCSD